MLLARETYQHAVIAARDGSTPAAWTRLLRAATNLRGALRERDGRPIGVPDPARGGEPAPVRRIGRVPPPWPHVSRLEFEREMERSRALVARSILLVREACALKEEARALRAEIARLRSFRMSPSGP